MVSDAMGLPPCSEDRKTGNLQPNHQNLKLKLKICYRFLMARFTLTVNGRAQAVDVDESTPLLYVLSDDLALNGPKFGCGLGQCGACTVIVKGQTMRSCMTPIKAVAGTEVGLGTPEKPHPLQQAFIDEQAAQCGFCLSGVILTAKALVDRTPRPTDEQIHQALSGVLCRCFAHARMIAAIKRYAQGRAV
jgi:nicotinate dehydrogenase subunit A